MKKEFYNWKSPPRSCKCERYTVNRPSLSLGEILICFICIRSATEINIRSRMICTFFLKIYISFCKHVYSPSRNREDTIDSHDYIVLFGLQISNRSLIKLVKLNKIWNAVFTYFCVFLVKETMLYTSEWRNKYFQWMHIVWRMDRCTEKAESCLITRNECWIPIKESWKWDNMFLSSRTSSNKLCQSKYWSTSAPWHLLFYFGF